MWRTSTEPSAPAKPGLRRTTLSGPTMGSRWTATIHADREVDAAALAARLAQAAGCVDGQMSTWKPASDLMRLNAAPVGAWVALPPEILEVLQAALRIGRLSGGAFDIGVGSVVAAFGFGAQAHDAGADPAPGFAPSIDLLELDPARGRARKHAPLALDLSGIAKGYGVDKLAACLEREGFPSWLVGLDGELRAHGRKPCGRPFAVALERPDPDRREAMSVIELDDCAVATSGDYRHRRRRGGEWVSHTIDPRTGAPLANGLASVTVLAPTAMDADALATALMVLGPDKGGELAASLRVDALFVSRAGDGFVHKGLGRFA